MKKQTFLIILLSVLSLVLAAILIITSLSKPKNPSEPDYFIYDKYEYENTADWWYKMSIDIEFMAGGSFSFLYLDNGRSYNAAGPYYLADIISPVGDSGVKIICSGYPVFSVGENGFLTVYSWKNFQAAFKINSRSFVGQQIQEGDRNLLNFSYLIKNLSEEKIDSGKDLIEEE